VLDNNPPPDNRAANRHGPAGPKRNTAARVANPMASTASPTAVPVGDGGSDAGANTNAHRTNNAANSIAPHRNRRSQPRTVEGGTPSRAAIRRCPAPAACSINAEPITSTLSRRRTRHMSANNTCVSAHDRHRARRGRNPNAPSPPRIVRHRPYPHRANTPPQSGHPKRPPTRSASTTSRSPLTMSTDASGITQEGPPRATAKKSEGVLARTQPPQPVAPTSPPPTRPPPRHRHPR
jgi:hypothetical protein